MFRKITGADKDLFLALSNEFYNSAAVLCPIPQKFHENTFGELMRSSDYLEGYIFEKNGKVCGFSVLNKMYCHEAGGLVVWIEELYVRPEFQGLGIGSAFFSWVEKNIPAARYRLEVEPENERACALYSRLGYEKLEYMQMYKQILTSDF